jgi:hypothetical protein
MRVITHGCRHVQATRCSTSHAYQRSLNMLLLGPVLLNLLADVDTGTSARGRHRLMRRNAIARRLSADAEHFLAHGVVKPPTRGQRLMVLVRRRSLDDRLRAGENALTDIRLAIRAGQLTDPNNRQRLAADLQALAARSQGPSGCGGAWSVRHELASLAAQLQDPTAVHERGVALALAVCDALQHDDRSTSPGSVRHAIACLGDVDPTAARNDDRRQ